jgi:hypothetical protein
MKTLICLLFLSVLSIQSHAAATVKTITWKNQKARDLMEGMLTVLPLYNHANTPSIPEGHIVTGAYGRFYCQWTDSLPDHLLSAVSCSNSPPGSGIPGGPFNMPYIWFKQIVKYSVDSGSGGVHAANNMGNLSCDLEIATKKYLCTLDVYPY